MIEKQIELEKQMTQCSIDTYRRELERAKEKENFSTTKVATQLISRILGIYKDSIQDYLDNYYKDNPVQSTIAAKVISQLDIDSVAYISAKVLLNKINSVSVAQAVYKAIGQALEDETKMRAFRDENKFYYSAIQKDLDKRGAKANRKKNITTGVFNHRLDFHLDRWTLTEKFHAGMILANIFMHSTGLIELHEVFKKGKTYKYVTATKELLNWIENTNEKLEVLQPFFLPMVCQPKEWTGIFDGGYISPYLKRNKLIKNNSREYLEKLKVASMPEVYSAINIIQNTEWQINRRVLEVVDKLWDEGKAIAELPDREDIELIPYPYPEKNTKTDSYTEEEIQEIKRWKRETYEIHKTNVKRRSIRILTAQILRIANQFKNYDKIWFPYQMDFRGRIYPIPVLLQPQGSDLAKGLLHFAEGKEIYGNDEAINWFKIHGANVYGYDKESYRARVSWVDVHSNEIKSYAENPLLNRGWAEADKPFQFLAWCFEYSDFSNNPNSFTTHIPIQLDGTCNGLQHYSALLRDSISGQAVNLLDSEKPSDIYAKVAERLVEKLEEIRDDETNRNSSTRHNSRPDRLYSDGVLSAHWLELGINRKLTKRPVMVLPYGGTRLSCREYIGEYLTDTYSPTFIWQHFMIGDSPTDCIFKISTWLSKYLWESITETLKSATVGMGYLRSVARLVNSKKKYLEWLTPVGLLVREEYQSAKHKTIRTELYGTIVETNVKINVPDTLDNQRQINGICPNFIHSLDAACLMKYLNRCKEEGINSFMAVHDCYGTLAPDTATSARILRESFVDIYKQPILEQFTQDVLDIVQEEIKPEDIPTIPERGDLEIESVLDSNYFFN